jgi:hypothetical protein
MHKNCANCAQLRDRCEFGLLSDEDAVCDAWESVYNFMGVSEQAARLGKIVRGWDFSKDKKDRSCLVTASINDDGTYTILDVKYYDGEEAEEMDECLRKQYVLTSTECCQPMKVDGKEQM